MEIGAAEAVALLDDLTAIVVRACAVIREVSPATVSKRLKDDQSPVTAADEASEAVILQGLARVVPELPVISEEMPEGQRPPGLDRSFVMVDPLDGTKEFLAGRDEFTVNLAVLTRGRPLAGIIAAPNYGLLWRGVVGVKAERLRIEGGTALAPEAIRTRAWPGAAAIAAISRSHLDAATEAFLGRLGPVARQASGSAIKFCRMAEGAVDVYPRLSTVCEWDVAAGEALVIAAGGAVVTPQGRPLAYGRAAENFRVPAFIAWGDASKAVVTP